MAISASALANEETEIASSTLGPTDWWPVLVVVVLYTLFFCAVLLCWGPFAGLSWQNRSALGDSFGTLSALFNGLAFAGLIITIFIQSRELRLQRKQLTLQRLELRAQRHEAERLADAQEEQSFLNAISCFVAAEAYTHRGTIENSDLMLAAGKFLNEHLDREMKRRMDRPGTRT